jgi:pimeloyl-ACP methyl ester carboxylesterase
MTTEAVDRLGAGRDVAGTDMPDTTTTTVHQLTTFDGATVHAVLHRLPGASTVITLMHPRQQLAHHPMIAYFLHMGVAVWTQDTRSPNNDINLVHEQAILDAAAGHVFLRDLGLQEVLVFGHSGGGALSAYYIEQALTRPEFRIDVTPAGRPIALSGALLPPPDGAIFLAPHPGQGVVLQHCIDPSVLSDTDPTAINTELDMYDPANGFAQPGTSSSYSADFLAAYRDAQRQRITHIDAIARERAEEAAAHRVRFAATRDPKDRRLALAPRIITTYRTDADPRYVDLSLEPNDRHYGSLFGRRPDLTNYGLVGFGRLTTPDAWLSTWSALSSNALFERCAAGVTIPTLYIEFSGDAAAFPADADRMYAAIKSEDKTRDRVRGQHFGQPISPSEPTGYEAASKAATAWLTERYPRANLAG